MKGIILAGGSGSRLYPMTKTTSKQLLSVYDKPMIYYPLSTLMLFGISEILIISTPRDLPVIRDLFGDGSQLGLTLDYKVQEEPNGIAQAFILGEEFIKRKSKLEDEDQDVCLILGDNIFYMGDQYHIFKREVQENEGNNATIFAYHVSEPERFGVVEIDKDHKAISIEEKPAHPKSNYALVGLYFYPFDVVEKAKSLKPSARGEYEITDLNKLYLAEDRLRVVPMRRGNAWLDAGTPDSLMAASTFVQIVEKRQGLKIACIEEIAYRRGFIDDKQMLRLIDQLKDGNSYKQYLLKVYQEYHELF
ncbi:MAG: glucose-1-phosphate thymidylyltransferase RfbA [Succinivibrionaceae bacterium]|nr:glucose-1-phosphate thymidylyltransferase RfbA [Succinivibrionaceae bacterium]